MNKFDLKDAYIKWTAHQKQIGRTDSQALEFAIGGEFEAFGIIEREMLKLYGLAEDGYLIDVGCGSGRLAVPLSQCPLVKYLGLDIVPDLVEHAKKIAARDDWKFTVVDRLEIPEKNDCADMVCFFSVLTHLLHEQSFVYLEEARRVLKPGGVIVFSFLEFSIASHWNVFASTVENSKSSDNHPLNMFISRDAIKAWAEHLNLEVLDIRNGDDAFVPLANPVTLDDGRVMNGLGNLGQSICALRKP